MSWVFTENFSEKRSGRDRHEQKPPKHCGRLLLMRTQLAGITDMDLFDRHGQPVEEFF